MIGAHVPQCLAVLSTIDNLWKEPKCPSTDEWVKEMWYIHTVENYLAMGKNEILPFAATCMELEGIMLNEISQRKTDVICFHSDVEQEKLNRRPWGKGKGQIVSNKEGGRQIIRDS